MEHVECGLYTGLRASSPLSDRTYVESVIVNKAVRYSVHVQSTKTVEYIEKERSVGWPTRVFFFSSDSRSIAYSGGEYSRVWKMHCTAEPFFQIGEVVHHVLSEYEGPYCISDYSIPRGLVRPKYPPPPFSTRHRQGWPPARIARCAEPQSKGLRRCGKVTHTMERRTQSVALHCTRLVG